MRNHATVDSDIIENARLCVNSNLTVAFHFNRPFCNLELALADAGFSILPRSAVENDSDFFRHPISSGQFVLKDWTPVEDHWKLEENPNYYAGRSRVRRFEFVVI